MKRCENAMVPRWGSLYYPHLGPSPKLGLYKEMSSRIPILHECHSSRGSTAAIRGRVVDGGVFIGK